MIFAAEDLFSENPAPTPLFAAAAAASTANIWTSVNGWAVARLFTSVDEEYEAAKTGAALIDMGAAARYALRGTGAASMLSRLTSAPAGGLAAGESAHGLMLNDEGGVIDVVETTCLADQFYLLTMTRPHARRLALAARGFDVGVEDISRQIAVIGLIGPDAHKAAAAAGLEMTSDHLAAQGMVRGVETAARPIQLGQNACIELIFPAVEALTIWERIGRASKASPLGLDAFDLLRIEAGVPRPGVDFIPAERASPRSGFRTPQELGLPHLAPLDRGWFNGRRALKRPAGPRRRAVTVLSVDADRAAAGAAVFAAGKPVGRITSSAFSPHLKRVVAFADIARAAIAKPLEVSAPGADEPRVPARLFDTAESGLAARFLSSHDDSARSDANFGI